MLRMLQLNTSVSDTQKWKYVYTHFLKSARLDHLPLKWFNSYVYFYKLHSISWCLTNKIVQFRVFQTRLLLFFKRSWSWFRRSTRIKSARPIPARCCQASVDRPRSHPVFRRALVAFLCLFLINIAIIATGCSFQLYHTSAVGWPHS